MSKTNNTAATGNTATETTARPLTEREAQKARKAYIEAQNAIDQTSAGRLYTAAELALLPHVPHAIKQIQVALISCANYRLMRNILLDCEFGKLPTAEEIHTMAAKIYNELINPPTWDYGQELKDFINCRYLSFHEADLLKKTFPTFNSYMNYRIARQYSHPDEFICITPKTEQILKETQARTGKHRTEIMIDLIEIATEAGLCERIQAKAAAAPEPAEKAANA